MSAANEAPIYAEQIQNIIARLGYEAEFSIIHIDLERLTPIDITREGIDGGYHYLFCTRLVQPVRRIRPNRIVASFIKALKASVIERLPPKEVESTSMDMRFRVMLTDLDSKRKFSLYYAMNGYGYVNNIPVSINGEIDGYLRRFAKQMFQY